jgi:hypothetical protein
MPESHGTAPRSNRARAVLAAAALVLSGVGLPPSASATLQSTPTLTLERTLGTSPFAESKVGMTDHEGSAYVPKDNSLWLADDDGRAIYEVDARTGAFKRRIRGDRFAAVRQLGGGGRAGEYRTQQIQGLAYDRTRDTLFAFSGTCCWPDIHSTAFRLTRQAGSLELDSYQPVSGVVVEGAAWNPGDRKVYVGSSSTLWKYSYARNTVGRAIAIPGVKSIYGMDFTNDGKDLFIGRPATRVTRVDWASRTIVPGWDVDLAPFGVLDVRAVEVFRRRLWVSDGSDVRASGDPLQHALFVFRLGG